MNWHAPSLPLVDIKALSGRAYELRSLFSRLSCQWGLCANQRTAPWDIRQVICPGKVARHMINLVLNTEML